MSKKIHIRNFQPGIKTGLLRPLQPSAVSASESAAAAFKIRFLLLLFLMILFPGRDSLDAQATYGSRSFALGGSSVSLAESGWSLFQNPALLITDLPGVSFYAMRYAGFSELTDLASELRFHGRLGAGGVGVHHYGFDLFSETRWSAGFGRTSGPLLYGAGLNYFHVSQGGDFGSVGAFGLDAGVGILVADGLLFAARGSNLNRPTYGDSGEKLPADLAVGLSASLSETLLTVLELVKDVRFPLSVRAGVEIELVPKLHARTGFLLEPEAWTAGFGYVTGRYSVNIAVQRHHLLGVSPAMDFGLVF